MILFSNLLSEDEVVSLLLLLEYFLLCTIPKLVEWTNVLCSCCSVMFLCLIIARRTWPMIISNIFATLEFPMTTQITKIAEAITAGHVLSSLVLFVMSI